MKYYTTYKENGNIIEKFNSIEDAAEAIHEYENIDDENENFTPDFYDIIDENNVSHIHTPKVILFRALKFIEVDKYKLCCLLYFLIPSCIDSINQDIDVQKHRLELIDYIKRFKEIFESTDGWLKNLILMAENWKQECSLFDFKKAKHYIDELKKSKEELISYNQKFNDTLTQAEIKGIETSQNFTNPSSDHPKNKVLSYGLKKIRNLVKLFCPRGIKITLKNNV